MDIKEIQTYILQSLSFHFNSFQFINFTVECRLTISCLSTFTMYYCLTDSNATNNY